MAQESPKFLPTNIVASYDGVGGMPPVQNGWWTCPQCGAVVPNGCSHSCPTTVRLAEGVVPQPKLANPYELTLQRIATALERIAEALEGE